MKNPKSEIAARRQEKAPACIEREWQETFDADLDAIWILDKDQRIVRCNKMAQRIFNLPSDEMIGRHCWEKAHGTAKPIPECPALRVKHSLRRESMELQIGGRWFAVYVDPILDADSRISGYVHIVSDINERKRSEEALRESEERFRKIFEEGRFGMVMVSKDFFFIRANAAFCSMLGYSETELVSRTFKDVTHPEHLAGDLENVACLSKGEISVYRTEKRYVRKDGGIIWGSAIVTAVRNDSGELLYFLVIVEDVTERKKAGDALRESEEKFRSVFDNSAVGKSITSMDGSMNANPAFCRMLGYTKDELARRNWQSISHPDDIELTKKHIEQLHTGEKSSARFIKRYYRKDGSIVWADVNTVLQKDGGGRPLYYITTAVDITEQKHAEAALYESEQRIRTFLDSTSDMAFLKDQSFRHLIANRALCRFYGKTESEILGKTDFDLMTEKNAEGCRRTDEQALLSNALVITEEAVGGRVFETMKFPVQLEGGQKGIGAYIRDITERKEAEQAIAAEKERLAVTLRSIGDAVIATDVRGNVVLMNKVAETLTGWPLEKASGKPLSGVFAVVDELTRERLESPAEKVLSSGEVIELADHSLLVSRDGIERVITDSGAPIKDADDKVIGVVLVFRDITEKQKYMDAVQRAAKLDSLGVLAGGIAHDFNNLLTGIFGYIDLARSEAKEAQAKEYLETALAAMNRARALTHQLLTFAEGGAPVQRIQSLVPFIRENAQFALSGSNVACRFFAAEELWPCNIDKNQIGQVIDNIVINAQQAMPNGGAIEITAANVSLVKMQHPPLAKGDYVRLSIRDFGIGIPKDIRPRIFDPFYTTKAKGHGLGLATCHSIVSRHGGCIDVESEPGKGSTFHVYLPASAGAVVSDGAAVTEHRGSGTIIVMDDEEIVRETLRQMLKSLGYAVICAHDGRTAIDLLIDETKAERRCAAIILDLTVPGGMGGMEAVKKIRKLDREIPVFVASGYADTPVMRNPEGYGFIASIPKPFTVAELSEALKKHLAN